LSDVWMVWLELHCLLDLLKVGYQDEKL
jgi:hypothetical protein